MPHFSLLRRLKNSRIDLHYMSAFSLSLVHCGIVSRTSSIFLILTSLYLVLSSPTNSDGGTNVQVAKAIRDINSTSLADSPNYCTSDDHWTGHSKTPWDCALALSAFEESYFMRTYGKAPVEFVAPGAEPKERFHYFSIPTPLKFRSKKCTITIAMLRQFPERGDSAYEEFRLPGNFDYFTDSNVILSFDDIYEAGSRLVSECINRRGERYASGGWRAVGVADSLGIFAWKTGSPMDLFIRQAQPKPKPGGLVIGAPFSNDSITTS